MHGASEAIFDRREDVVGEAVVDRREGCFERGARDESDVRAGELQRGFFAERSAFALECDPRFERKFHARAAFRVRDSLRSCDGPLVERRSRHLTVPRP